MEVVNFKDIKVGDKVIVTHNGAYAHKMIKEVTKVGNTFIEIDGQKYCNKTGALKPYKMSFYILRLANEEDEKEIKLRKRRSDIVDFLNNIDLKFVSKLSEDVLIKYEKIIQEIKDYTNKGIG